MNIKTENNINKKILLLSIYLLAFSLSFLLPQKASADGAIDRGVDTSDIEQAMREAEKEYHQEVNVWDASKKVPNEDLKSVINSLAKNTSKKEKSALIELASQVDELTNRLIIQRATLSATQSPKNVRVKGATTVFNYNDNAVYEVTSAVNYVTDIRLKAGEKLSSAPTAGDTVRWKLSVMKSGMKSATGGKRLERTHIILKPTERDIQTNLLITTNLHTYQLSIKSSDTHMPSVSWNYPEDFQADFQKELKEQELSRKKEEQVQLEQIRQIEIEDRNNRLANMRNNYEISGDDVSFKPQQVFDDGRKTFIKMPTNITEAPALFIIEDDELILTNYRLENDFYVVDRIFEKAELRIGSNKIVEIEIDDGKNFFERLFNL